jgi:hypothetical protein
MQIKINDVWLRITYKLTQKLGVVMLTLVSAHSNAAWFVNDVTLNLTAKAIATAVEASVLNDKTPPAVLMPITANLNLVATLLPAASLVPAGTISKHQKIQCMVATFNSKPHPADLIIKTACGEMVVLRDAMTQAYDAYISDMKAMAVLADAETEAGLPTLGGATAQSLVVQKAHLAQAMVTSSYVASMDYAKLQMDELRLIIKINNSKKIYGIL